MGGAAEVYSALHNVNVGVVPGGAEGVVVVVAVVILRAEFATDVFGEVELEAVVGALTGFGKAIGGAACRVLIGFFKDMRSRDVDNLGCRMSYSLFVSVSEVDFPVIPIDERTIAFPVRLFVAGAGDKSLELSSGRCVRISNH